MIFCMHFLSVWVLSICGGGRWWYILYVVVGMREGLLNVLSEHIKQSVLLCGGVDISSLTYTHFGEVLDKGVVSFPILGHAVDWGHLVV